MADGIITTLLENVKNNLSDTTNFNSIAGVLEKVIVSGEFKLYPLQARYAVIVPGPAEDEEDLTSVTVWWQTVEIYLVSRREKRRRGDKALLGGNVNGLETMAKDARQALNRSSPYDGAIPTGFAGYTSQTGVLNTRFNGVEYLGEEEEENKRPAEVAVLSLSFLCADTKSA